jgi:hypothetical protein
MSARNAASLGVMEPTRVAALVCGGGGPLPGSDGRRERVLAFADRVKTVDGMTTWLRSIGTPEEAVAESLARNDSAAVSATMAGAAECYRVQTTWRHSVVRVTCCRSFDRSSTSTGP